MNRDRSLDEFADGAGSDASDGTTGGADGSDADYDPDAGDDAAHAADEPGADPNGTEGADDTDDNAAPAEPTHAWSPDAACAACGGAATTRWRQDGAYVCPDCKEW